MNPSVGRIVHYTNLGDKDGKYPPQVQAAIITAVYHDGRRINEGVPSVDMKSADLTVDLKVLYNTGIFDTLKVPQAQVSGQRGAWDWPARS